MVDVAAALGADVVTISVIISVIASRLARRLDSSDCIAAAVARLRRNV